MQQHSQQRRQFLQQLAALGVAVPAGTAQSWLRVPELTPATAPPSIEAREEWVRVMERLAHPVLTALAAGTLKTSMPIELSTTASPTRKDVAHLEAVGRLLAGMAPWLELGADDTAEGKLRARYADLARRGLDHATDPASPDYLNFVRGGQPLVDAAFLAHALVRAPAALWAPLDARTKRNVAAALMATRAIKPGQNNWLLFSAMIEAALCSVGESWDRAPVDYAIRQHEQWYKGDGMYGDGAVLHMDYYNSYVIQPMLLDVLQTVSAQEGTWKAMEPAIVARARRYAAIQERLISPEGTFPPIGRSIVYRCGAFQLLGQMALRHELPSDLRPAQVRGALSAVIGRTLDAAGTFDAGGWLTIGLAGHQPSLGESYITNGSAYLCAVGLLPLGLSAADPFWTAPAEPWTSKALWSGQDRPPDHALG
jgi:hypothetical protein